MQRTESRALLRRAWLVAAYIWRGGECRGLPAHLEATTAYKARSRAHARVHICGERFIRTVVPKDSVDPTKASTHGGRHQQRKSQPGQGEDTRRPTSTT